LFYKHWPGRNLVVFFLCCTLSIYLKYTHMKSHSCSEVREVVVACIRRVVVTMGHPRSCHTWNLWVNPTVGHRPTTEWPAIC
jgi:hypothetical protein